jgi:hypothetical protein
VYEDPALDPRSTRRSPRRATAYLRDFEQVAGALTGPGGRRIPAVPPRRPRLLLWWLVMAGVGLLRSSRCGATTGPTRMPSAAIAEARGEIEAQTAVVANQILELSDRVELARRPRGHRPLRRASDVFRPQSSVWRRPRPPPPLRAALADDLDDARWELAAAEALVEGSEVPDARGAPGAVLLRPDPRRGGGGGRVVDRGRHPGGVGVPGRRREGFAGASIPSRARSPSTGERLRRRPRLESTGAAAWTPSTCSRSSSGGWGMRPGIAGRRPTTRLVGLPGLPGGFGGGGCRAASVGRSIRRLVSGRSGGASVGDRAARRRWNGEERPGTGRRHAVTRSRNPPPRAVVESGPMLCNRPSEGIQRVASYLGLLKQLFRSTAERPWIPRSRSSRPSPTPAAGPGAAQPGRQGDRPPHAARAEARAGRRSGGRGAGDRQAGAAAADQAKTAATPTESRSGTRPPSPGPQAAGRRVEPRASRSSTRSPSARPRRRSRPSSRTPCGSRSSPPSGCSSWDSSSRPRCRRRSTRRSSRSPSRWRSMLPRSTRSRTRSTSGWPRPRPMPSCGRRRRSPEVGRVVFGNIPERPSAGSRLLRLPPPFSSASASTCSRWCSGPHRNWARARA